MPSSKKNVVAYLQDTLSSVGRMAVDIEVLEHLPTEAHPKRAKETLILSSLRLDRVVSTAFHLGRAKAQEAIRQGLVMLDGVPETRLHATVDPNIRISLRHKGKIRILGATHTTKNGNTVLEIERYL